MSSDGSARERGGEEDVLHGRPTLQIGTSGWHYDQVAAFSFT